MGSHTKFSQLVLYSVFWCHNVSVILCRLIVPCLQCAYGDITVRIVFYVAILTRTPSTF